MYSEYKKNSFEDFKAYSSALVITKSNDDMLCGVSQFRFDVVNAININLA